MKSRLELLTIIAMAACVIGAIAFCIGLHQAWAVILIGALLLFFIRLHARMKSNDFNQQRILSILMFSAIALCLCAYFMMNSKSYWPIPLLISASVELYASFRLK